MPAEPGDLAFADFEANDALLSSREGGFGRGRNGAMRRYPSLGAAPSPEDTNAPGMTYRGRLGFLERETGFEAATLGLGKRGVGSTLSARNCNRIERHFRGGQNAQDAGDS